MIDKMIEQITNEVEKRILKNLEQLTFNIEVKVSKGDEEDGIPHRDETMRDM